MLHFRRFFSTRGEGEGMSIAKTAITGCLPVPRLQAALLRAVKAHRVVAASSAADLMLL